MSDEAKRRTRRTMTGIVTSHKMDKTIVVEIRRTVMHPIFKKYMRKGTKFQAHDEKNEASTGDKVEIMETRPISKKKSFRLVKVLAKARIPASTPKVETAVEMDDGAPESGS